MTDTLIRVTSPFFYEGVCAATTAIALVAFALRFLRWRRLGDALLGVAWLCLLASFLLPWLPRVLGWELHAIFDSQNAWHLPVQYALRYYLGLPLLFLGCCLSGPRSRIGISTERRPEVKVESSGKVSGLTDSLAEANRDLENARGALRKSASETDQVSSKLRETLNLLLNSEEKFRSTFERANDGFVIADIEKKVIDEANPGMALLTGYELHQLAGMPLAQIYGPTIGEYGLAEYRKIAGQRDLPPITIQRRDGDTIRGEISFSIIHMGGRPMLLGIARDITERVRLMEQLEERNLELKEVNSELSTRADEMRIMNERLQDLQKLKDRFVSSVSHELRTPLTSIRSFSEIMLEYPDADPEVQREFLTIINKESERLTRLINDVLDLARIEAGETGLEFSEVDLAGVVSDVARSLDPIAEQAGTDIKVMLPSDLPRVEGNRDRLQQVVTNLLSNALRFAPEKSSVEVGARLDHQGMVEVAVRDHGPGIEKTELENIFDRFQQVDRGSADDTAGTGLGLAICREIVTLHGGRIWGVSRVGRGSTFYFTLKIHTAVEGPEEDVDESLPKRVGDLPPLKSTRTKEPRPKARRSLPPIQA
jgi:PAS domain S-box-containing protein